jgi:hypothetical protein
MGSGAIAAGNQSMALGVSSLALGDSSTAVGQSAMATAMGASAFGWQSAASGTGAIAAGAMAVASGPSSAAYGAGASATGASSVAVGTGAVANAANSTALGASATVATSNTNSTAIGAGATTTADNQIVLGTVSQTYQTPGIDSQTSRDRQSGPLRLVTSDSQGDLATDGGSTFTEIAKLRAGTAVAMAMQAPTLGPGENFGLRLGYGNFDSHANAVGLTAMGNLCRQCYLGIDRISIDVGAGVGTSTFNTYNSGAVLGARVGGQLTWK